MKEIVEIIAKSLVDNTSAVVINEKEEDNVVIYELHVATEDMGKVIGNRDALPRHCALLSRPLQPARIKK